MGYDPEKTKANTKKDPPAKKEVSSDTQRKLGQIATKDGKK